MKHIKSFLLTTTIAISTVTIANAQPTNLKPLNPDAIVCESKSALEEFMKYAANGDRSSIMEMDTCYNIKPGIKYRILESSIGGMVKIKVYMGNNDEGAIAWTMKSAL